MSEPGRVVTLPASSDAIELRHLRSFVAVAEELNFGRAADRLYITQPALSRQIRALERLVGGQLLRRSTRHVELTIAGEALLERARHLLKDVDDAVVAVQALTGEIMARIAGLWQPVHDRVSENASLEEQRVAFEELLAHFEVPSEVTVRPVNAGGVPALVVATDHDPPPGVLFLHGGGFVLGSAFGMRPLAGALALASECGVLVVDYRLAPEHRFPAALDDARTAYQWLVGRAGDPRRIVVAGDSTGAALAIALLLRLRAEDMPLPAAAALLSPVGDLGGSTVEIDPDDPVQEVVARFWRGCTEAYLAGHPVDDPLVSPVYGDPAGLPPLQIQSAAQDLLRTEAEALGNRAKADGVDVDLRLYPIDAHLFYLFWTFLPEAVDAIEAAGRFVRAARQLGDPAGAGELGTG